MPQRGVIKFSEYSVVFKIGPTRCFTSFKAFSMIFTPCCYNTRCKTPGWTNSEHFTQDKTPPWMI